MLQSFCIFISIFLVQNNLDACIFRSSLMLNVVKMLKMFSNTQKLVKMHNTQIPPTNLLFDQKEDLEPSTQTAVADDRRFKWNNLEAALMLFSCSFRSELENFSQPPVTSSFTNEQIQSPKRSSLKYFCSQKCKLSKKRGRWNRVHVLARTNVPLSSALLPTSFYRPQKTVNFQWLLIAKLRILTEIKCS